MSTKITWRNNQAEIGHRMERVKWKMKHSVVDPKTWSNPENDPKTLIMMAEKIFSFTSLQVIIIYILRRKYNSLSATLEIEHWILIFSGSLKLPFLFTRKI